MPTGPITDWAAAIITSIGAALAIFFAAIPRIIGFILILVIGWWIASGIAAIVDRLLRAANFERLAERSGISDFVAKTGIRGDATRFVADVVKWFIRLIVLIVAFDALGLPAVSVVLLNLLLWLPNLIVALIVLVIGGIAAKALSSIVRGSAAKSGLGNPDLLANVASIVVWAFAIIVAVNQLGIAATIVNTLFMAFVGALALAFGLAFGLGGRDTAGEIVRNLYERGRRSGPKIERAATEMRREAEARREPGSTTETTYRVTGEDLDKGPTDDEGRRIV